MVKTTIAAVAVFLIIQRAGELYLAQRNKEWSLQQGAIEFGTRHYPLFFILHAAWFAGWIAEARAVNGLSQVWYLWLGLFIAAQGLRYWCISALGRQWNTRILVIPGYKAVKKGPYRYMRHPNYLAVAVELLCVPMLFGAVYTASAITVLNALLLFRVRIPEEEKALRFL